MNKEINLYTITKKLKHTKWPNGDRLLIAICYLFLVIPIILFFFGWLKPVLAAAASLILLIGAYLSIRKFVEIESHQYSNFRFIALTFFIVTAWIVLSGIGGFGNQNYDFNSRNAVFRDLIDHPWPVIYDFSENPIISSAYGDTGAFVYYLAFWLPSALVGKLTEWMTANYALFVWSIIGVLLSVLLITRYIGKPKILIPILFIFWSGLDLLGSFILNYQGLINQAYVSDLFSIRTYLGNLLASILNVQQLEWWSGAHLFQYSSFTTQLFWVFNQSIPAWLITLLLINHKKRESLVFTYSLILFYAPLPALGLFPFLLFKLIEPEIQKIKSNTFTFKHFLNNTISFQNTIPPLVITLLAFSYYSTTAGNHPNGLIWNMSQISWHRLIIIYLIFCFTEFFLFSLFVFNGNSEKPILIFTIVLLFLIPFYQYGSSNDFVMRASIPPLLVLFTIGFKNIFSKYQEIGNIKKEFMLIILIIILLIGSVTPLHEIMRSRDEILAADGFPDFADTVITLTILDEQHPVYRLEWITQFVAFDPYATFFFKTLTR